MEKMKAETEQVQRCLCPSHRGDGCFNRNCQCAEHYGGACSGFILPDKEWEKLERDIAEVEAVLKLLLPLDKRQYYQDALRGYQHRRVRLIYEWAAKTDPIQSDDLLT